MAAFALIALVQAVEPDWMKAAGGVTAEVTEINTMSSTLGGMDWALPIGVLALVFLRISPILGQMLQEEHKLSIERRRKEQSGGTRADKGPEGN